MRFVELKSQDDVDMQTLHRSRGRLVGERAALINQLRAILLERGFLAPQGERKLERFLTVLMDEQGGAELSPRVILLVADAWTQWAEFDRRIEAFDAEFVGWARENEDAKRLVTIPGFGAIVASALVAAVGRAEARDRSGDLSVWLGIVPRQFTTGGKPKLLGVSKRSTGYLRRQLIHGKRARRCPMSRSATRRSAGGRRRCLNAPIATSRSSPSPTSWPGSPGRCCGGENGLTPQDCLWRRRGSADWLSLRHRSLREGERRDGLTVERRFGSLV